MIRSSYNRELMYGVERCEDGHRCENGSKCVEDPNNENTYHCDCDEGTAGYYCSHTATEYCSKNKKHFCTNLGTCLIKVEDDDPHPGCDCRKDYDGKYCQFVKGTAPEQYTRKSDNALTIPQAAHDNVEHTSVVTPFGLFFLMAFFAAFVVSIAVLSRKVMKNADGKMNGPEFVIELEDDDDVLFDDIDDYNYGLQIENPDSVHGAEKKSTSTKPKQIT